VGQVSQVSQEQAAKDLPHANWELIEAVREGLARRAIPEKAEPMRAYMKSTMPYIGAPNPQQRETWKEVFARYPLATFEAWHDTVLALWRGATYREERYGAIELTEDRRYKRFQTPDTVLMYEEMIVDGAWWDFVDHIASHRMGALLRSYPEVIRPLMLSWSEVPDMWLRRTSIICQLGFKAATDLELLTACIEPNLSHKDFFIRKAIGWALRQYAYIDADWVRRYVQEHESQLSPLSRREALKHL
jgi:3-methyladenine DNA glycosylase AlkD